MAVGGKGVCVGAMVGSAVTDEVGGISVAVGGIVVGLGESAIWVGGKAVTVGPAAVQPAINMVTNNGEMRKVVRVMALSMNNP